MEFLEICPLQENKRGDKNAKKNENLPFRPPPWKQIFPPPGKKSFGLSDAHALVAIVIHFKSAAIYNLTVNKPCCNNLMHQCFQPLQ